MTLRTPHRTLSPLCSHGRTVPALREREHFDWMKYLGWFLYWYTIPSWMIKCSHWKTRQINKTHCWLDGLLGKRRLGILLPEKKKSVSCSVLSHSLWPLGLQPTRLLCPWVLRARILEWVAIPFSKESSWPRDWTALHIDSLPSELPGTWGCTKHQSGLWERSRKGRPEIAGDREMEEVLKRWRQRPSKQPCKMQGFTVFEALGYHF